MTEPATLAEEISEEMSTVLVGMDDLIEQLTISLLSRGHILLEGVPGVAKTTLANTFAQASGLSYARVQMTPDILPADITGSSVYREWTGEFELRKGPVFTNVVVADEINRATPKTQSALLEAMAEGHVSIEGDTLDLPDPFLVIATQNPIDMEGTFELPEAQRDRFQQKLIVDLPDNETERTLLKRFDDIQGGEPPDVSTVVSPEDIKDAREAVTEINVEDAVREYILDLVTASREHPNVAHGVSPRGSLALLHTSKARAAIHNREYVISDDVKELVEPVLRHRLVLTTDAELSNVGPDDVIADIRDSVTPPSGKVLNEDQSNVPDEADEDFTSEMVETEQEQTE
jgi:MoxR-like ATPase